MDKQATIWDKISTLCKEGKQEEADRLTISLQKSIEDLEARHAKSLENIVPNAPTAQPQDQKPKSRIDYCKECDEFNGEVCEKAFPEGRCRCGWFSFLNNSHCTDQKW